MSGARSYAQQSIRNRPGLPYETGDAVTNRIVVSIEATSKCLDKIKYKVKFINCGHYGICSHKTLVRAEIGGNLGACRECLRLERESKVKPPVVKKHAWPPHPDRDLHMWAHNLWALA